MLTTNTGVQSTMASAHPLTRLVGSKGKGKGNFRYDSGVVFRNPSFSDGRNTEPRVEVLDLAVVPWEAGVCVHPLSSLDGICGPGKRIRPLNTSLEGTVSLGSWARPLKTLGPSGNCTRFERLLSRSPSLSPFHASTMYDAQFEREFRTIASHACKSKSNCMIEECAVCYRPAKIFLHSVHAQGKTKTVHH